MKAVSYSVGATKQLRKLPANIRERVVDKLHRYAETGAGDVKTLTGQPGARLRIGDYRAVFVERPMQFRYARLDIGVRFTSDEDMKPQFIKTESGELVVLPRRDYEVLVKRAKGAKNEDEGTARIVVRSNAALAAGDEVELPGDVAEAIARGENPLRVIREWRGMTQMYLGETKTDIGQSTISALENGSRRGTTAVWKQLAKVLRVPMAILIPD